MATSLTRRDFGKAVAAAGVATVIAGTDARAQQRIIGASDRIRLGFIAVGNRGDQVLDAFLSHPDAQVVAVADLHAPYRDFAAKKIVARGNTAPDLTDDYRRVLDRKDIDAVVINTPDHWHALQTVEACAAGKDVYVEKPLSLCVAEGRAMVTAARKHNRVTQVGIHRRSSLAMKQLAEFIQSGGIGKLMSIRAFHVQNEWPHGISREKDGQPPAGFDWDKWLGPAPIRPYNKNRTFYRFRWFWDYSGGQVTNFGTHYIDMAHWAMGEQVPTSVAALGGKFVDFDDREVPDTCQAMWTYPSGVLVTFTQINANGAAPAARPCEMEFRGTRGTVYMGGSGFEVVPETSAARAFPVMSPLDRAGSRGWRNGKQEIEGKVVKGDGTDPTTAHARDFLDCLKSRAACRCDIETGHRSTTATLIANVALRKQATLEWDGKAERFTNNDSANELLKYEYRKPYAFPT